MKDLIRVVSVLALVFFAAWTGRPVMASEPLCAQDQTEFPDYKPKLTPDTVTDYRPAIGPKLDLLPPADLEALPGLIRALEEHKGLARANPGKRVPGRVYLGADPEEYEPSEEELLAGEIGRRIRQVVGAADPGDLKRVLSEAGVKDTHVDYNEFSFRHVDVMGSGRFFYASEPVPIRIGFD